MGLSEDYQGKGILSGEKEERIIVLLMALDRDMKFQPIKTLINYCFLLNVTQSGPVNHRFYPL